MMPPKKTEVQSGEWEDAKVRRKSGKSPNMKGKKRRALGISQQKKKTCLMMNSRKAGVKDRVRPKRKELSHTEAGAAQPHTPDTSPRCID